MKAVFSVSFLSSQSVNFKNYVVFVFAFFGQKYSLQKKGLQGVTGGCRGLQGVTGGYKRLQGFTRGYSALQGVTGG